MTDLFEVPLDVTPCWVEEGVMFAAFATTYTPEPTRCAGGPSPGAVVLQDWVCDDSPWAKDLTNLGIYVCRTIAGSTRLSSHASGRAGDSGVRVVTGGHPAGHALAAWLVRNHAVLGIQEVIWNRRRWTNQTNQWRDYDGVSPHLDHVHWALNTSGGVYLTRARVLSVAPTTTPTTAPPTLEDEADMFFASAKANTNVWLFEQGRRTLVNSTTDRAQLAKAAGIPNEVAEISDGFFANLAEGRTVHQ